MKYALEHLSILLPVNLPLRQLTLFALRKLNILSKFVKKGIRIHMLLATDSLLHKRWTLIRTIDTLLRQLAVIDTVGVIVLHAMEQLQLVSVLLSALALIIHQE